MFTMKHLERVIPELKGYTKERVYSFAKNRLSYKLSLMSSKHRGTCIESMIRDEYIIRGHRVEYFSGNCCFDMRVDGRRIEVKSSLAQPYYSVRTGKISCRYNFQNIKTECFDCLILVFVHPEQGLILRKLGKKSVDTYISNGMYREGQSISITSHLHRMPGVTFA